MSLLLPILAAAAAQSFNVGDRVEARPWGTRWLRCTILSRPAGKEGGYGVRCADGTDYFVTHDDVRAAPEPTPTPDPAPNPPHG